MEASVGAVRVKVEIDRVYRGAVYAEGVSDREDRWEEAAGDDREALVRALEGLEDLLDSRDERLDVARGDSLDGGPVRLDHLEPTSIDLVERDLAVHRAVHRALAGQAAPADALARAERVALCGSW